MSSLSLLELAHQSLQWEKAVMSLAVQRAQSEARVLQVNTIFHIKIHISIQIKIRTKIAGWETTNVRTLEEAQVLAR